MTISISQKYASYFEALIKNSNSSNYPELFKSLFKDKKFRFVKYNLFLNLSDRYVLEDKYTYTVILESQSLSIPLNIKHITSTFYCTKNDSFTNFF